MQKIQATQAGISSLAEHKGKLVQFFSLLIEIDQKNKRKGNEDEKANKKVF